MAQPEKPSPGKVEPPHWFVIANGSRARAYVPRVGDPGYDVASSWDSPEARMTSAELGEDRPGRVFPAAGASQRSGIEPEAPEQSPKGHAQREFEALLLKALTQGLRGRVFSGFYLIAPAPLLHRLEAALPHDLRRLLLGTHAGDFTQRPTTDVFRQLDALRWGAGAGWVKGAERS